MVRQKRTLMVASGSEALQHGGRLGDRHLGLPQGQREDRHLGLLPDRRGDHLQDRVEGRQEDHLHLHPEDHLLVLSTAVARKNRNQNLSLSLNQLKKHLLNLRPKGRRQEGRRGGDHRAGGHRGQSRRADLLYQLQKEMTPRKRRWTRQSARLPGTAQK